ncbi:HD family phosphohydrolase [Desulfotruncus alcoholivorax]|uniref:HD family phosphohydrolase n=1 Tax=Desulfotruncus alcoholivorax TaxID=265477 RepID=UPI0004036975|nr:HDIG domain-containing metalloprotein [Desulfotruncus alcoholivorax]
MLPLAKVRAKISQVFLNLAGRRKVRRGLAAFVFFVVLTLLISVEFMPQRINLVVGQVSPTNVFAPRSVTYEDKNKTAEARNIAAAQVEKQYIIDPQVSIDVQKNISSLIADIGKVQNDGNLDENQKVSKLKEIIPFSLSNSTLKILSRPNPENLKKMETGITGLISQAMDEGVTQENTAEVGDKLVGRIPNLQLEAPYNSVAADIIKNYLRPNKFDDLEKTRRLQQSAREAVSPVMVSIKEGEKIIGAGEIVTEEHISKLEALGLSRPVIPISSILGSALLVGLLMVVVLFYLYQQNREIYKNAGHIYLLGIVVFLTLGVSKAIIAINLAQWPAFAALFGYLAPIAAAGMLIAILLDSRLAVLVVAVISFLLGLMTGGQIRFAVVALIGGITGVYGVSKLSQRSDMARAGFYTGAANILAIFSMGMISGTPLGLTMTSSLILGSLNGILSSVLTNGAVPYLESAFGITSSVRLLELSNPGNPLLRRMQIEAPGTYHHSLLVGNLAESAADAVGGDSLLVRVAAYYHDIGKMKRPYFFIENQMGDNPHDKIAPTLSTLILTSHVKDGVELARENKLPQGITDIIEQHHGDSLCSFFYHKAVENNKNESVSEDEFRYEGPKPQTKEAAIVMLADAVEAAVRSLQNGTPGRIEGVVRKIIKDKLMDGQLDESDLTFKDLDAIAATFIRMLSGIFHNRIEYPDMTKEMERRKKKRAIGR